MINGKTYSWEDVSIAMPYGLGLDIEGIDYDDKMPTVGVYGKGGLPRRHARKNYEASCKVSVLSEDYDRFCQMAKSAGVGVYDLGTFPITVSYGNEDEPLVTDTLPSVKLTSVKKGVKQGDEKVTVELEFIVLAAILWNGVPATVRG